LVVSPNRRCRKGEQGAALIITVLIAFIVFLLVASWLITTTRRLRLISLERDRLQAFYTAEAGINKALWYLKGNGDRNASWRTQDEEGEEEPVEDTLFVGRADVARLSVQDRGAFLGITSRGRARWATKEVSVTMGTELSGVFGPAVTVASQTALVLDAGTEIVGNFQARVPPVEMGGRIEGKKRIDGNVALPPFDSSSLTSTAEKFRAMLGDASLADEELFSPQIFDERNLPDFAGGKTIYVNDLVLIEGGEPDAPLIIKGPGTIISINEIQVSGTVRLLDQVTLVAQDEVRLLESAELYDGMIYAGRKIGIREESQFRGQALTPGKIVVGEEATVHSPSVLFAGGGGDGQREGRIVVDGDAIVTASLLAMQASSGGGMFQGSQARGGAGRGTSWAASRGGQPGTSRQAEEEEATIYIGEDALVRGLVYTPASAEIRGTVRGAVAIGEFYSKALSSTPGHPMASTNRVVGATIDRGGLPADFVAPFGFAGSQTLRLVSWIEL
jgi:cytoskeletal protein CcmA (bactofilin family)